MGNRAKGMDTKKEVVLTIITILRSDRAVLQYGIIPETHFHHHHHVSVSMPETMAFPFAEPCAYP
jgi:hypothetical protein